MRTRRLVPLLVFTLLSTAASGFAPEAAQASPALSAAKACRGKLTSIGKSYANARRRFLLSCIGKLLKCSLQEEIEHSNVNTCRSNAISSCINKLNTVDQGLLLKQQKFVEKLALGCAAMTADNLCSTANTGLWFDNDPVCGSTNMLACGNATKDLPTILGCIRGEIEAEVDKNVGRIAPRGGLLLDNIGLGSLFPLLPRPATTTVTITATAAGSGIPNAPNGGTINLTAGNSLTIIGDDTTLPCDAMTTNGSLTIEIGTGTACTNSMVVEQRATIDEPYGMTRPAVFGPYNDDKVICVTLKDKQQGMMNPGCTTPQGNDVAGIVDIDVPIPQPTPATSSTVMMACHNKLAGKAKTLSGFVANKLHGCGDKVAKCELAKAIDGPTACTASYTKPCGVMTSVIESKLSVFKINVTTTGKCPIIPFAHLQSFIGGLGMSNSGGDCAGAGGLSALADCIYGVNDTASGLMCNVENKSTIRDPRMVDSFTDPMKANLTTALTDFPCLGP